MRTLSEQVTVESLLLDPENPRLPEDLQGAEQPIILAYLYEHDVLTELVDSYLTNGFFPNEQLLVLPPREDGKRIVVEGNRRLGALKYLFHDATAREAGLPLHVTDPPPAQSALDELKAVPAVELADRDELSSYLGFRHINGLKTWAPEAKARYLYGEVEKAREKGDPNPFYTVGRRVGSNALGVRNAYHAYNTLRYARDEIDLRPLASAVLSDRFGVWTRLLGTANATKFIGLSPIDQSYESVVSSTYTVQRDKMEAVLKDLTPQDGNIRALLNDSRDVTGYSDVLGNPAALEVLRRYGRLDLAIEIANGSNFDDRLTRLRESIQVATREILEGVVLTAESLSLSQSILLDARSLAGLVKANFTDSDEPDE